MLMCRDEMSVTAIVDLHGGHADQDRIQLQTTTQVLQTLVSCCSDSAFRAFLARIQR